MPAMPAPTPWWTCSASAKVTSHLNRREGPVATGLFLCARHWSPLYLGFSARQMAVRGQSHQPAEKVNSRDCWFLSCRRYPTTIRHLPSCARLDSLGLLSLRGPLQRVRSRTPVAPRAKPPRWKLSRPAGSLNWEQGCAFFRMKFSRLLSVILIFLLCGVALAAEPPAPVLPGEFAGWQVKGAVARSDDPAVADAANATVLKEYGFQRLEKAAYTRDDGRNLVIKAAVFADASGAYGAF